MKQFIRPDLHIAFAYPDDWTLMELDEQAGVRVSEPTDPRIALQVVCDRTTVPLDEQEERVRNGIPADATCTAAWLRSGRVVNASQALPEDAPVPALAFAARDASFVFRVFIAVREGCRWTIRAETLQRKEWWQETRTLESILTGLLLL